MKPDRPNNSTKTPTTWRGVLRAYLIDKLLEILVIIGMFGSFFTTTLHPSWVAVPYALTVGFIVAALIRRYRSY